MSRMSRSDNRALAHVDQSKTRGLIGGRYELLDRLGAGGMGEVYCSRDRLTEEVVALKRALQMPAVVADSTPTQRFFPESGPETGIATAGAGEQSARSSEEAQIARLALASEFRVLSSLRHPNIVSVLDYGFQANGLPFFTMKRLADSMSIVRAALGQPLDVQLDLLFQMLQALSYLHRHGIVHRDLKSSNVLVTGRHVTVLDFGVAGLPEHAGAGTAGFIAPEVLRGARPTPGSDFYAVGAMAYQILTESPWHASLPLPGEDPHLAALERLGAIGQLVKTLLSPDPVERRYTDANLLIADLARAARREVPAESFAHRESYLKAAPLTGRQSELALLATALESASAGKGSAWLVGGESGVGKSRLLDEVRSRALVQGFLALTGRAEENQAPYSVFRDSVLRLALVVEVSDEEAGILKIVFPEIERVLGRPIPDSAVDPQIFQERLIEIILSLFQRYKATILLELQDCHLAGESLAVMQKLTQTVNTLPLLIIASFRDDERPQLPSECPGMRLLHMTRFNRIEIRDITVSMLGKELGRNPAIVSFLERETEGNAFFLVETVRELAEASGRLDSVSPEMLPEHVFSGGMKDYARRRLDRLPLWAQSPIQVAAIIGRDVDLDVLRAAAPDTDLDALLVVCGDAAILEGYGYHWRFTHDKLRESVLAEIGRDSRRELSLEAATAIESVHGAAPDWIQAQAVLWKEAGVPDKAAHYLVLAAAQMLSTGAPEKAVQFAVDAARQLSVDLPDSREQQGAAIGAEMQKIGELMAGRGPAQLAELPPLSNERVARVIGILMLIGPAAHISQKLELFALSTLKCFTLTLQHGIGSDGPKVIAMYAAVVRGLTQNSQLAYEFSTLAMDLDQKLYGRVSSPVAFLHAWFVNHWINPLPSNLTFAREGARIGLTENELLYGCFNAAAYVMYLNFSGAPLQQVAQEADRQMARIAERVRVAAFHCLLERQLALALQGRTVHRLSLSDDRYEEERDVASICATSNYNQIGYYCVAKMRLHYYYGEYEAALRCAEQALPILPAFQGQVGEWEFVFYRALASAARAQELSGPERESMLGTGEELLAKFEAWARIGPSNFAHKRDLIRAELLRARHEHQPAADAYEAAVISAAESGFVHDQALAHERALLFYQASGDTEKSRAHAQAAVTHYEKWEAWSKSAAIRDTLLSPKATGASPAAKQHADSLSASSMTPERWEQAKKLFEMVHGLDPGERASFLDRACPDDPALRDEVESLISGDRRAGDFLQKPILADAAPTEVAIRVGTLSLGQVLSGRFQVIRFLGRGGMGEVYEAKDLDLGERVALKTIRPEIASQPLTMARFKQEIQLARRVTYPNVCRMFDLEHHRPPLETDPAAAIVTFLTMELLEGETLAARLRRAGRMATAEALPLVQQMTEALAAAHEVGVVHGDFKPGNVMLVPSKSGDVKERVVVTDFGLAKAVAAAGQSADQAASDGPAPAVTPGGHLIGTVNYMAPEQLRGCEPTPASDMYGLGLVMYEMVAGKRPFPNDTLFGGAYQRMKQLPVSPRVHVPDLDPQWEQVILSCLEVDPARRIASARDVVPLLLSIIEGIQI